MCQFSQKISSTLLRTTAEESTWGRRTPRSVNVRHLGGSGVGREGSGSALRPFMGGWVVAYAGGASEFGVRPAALGRRGMVASANPLATQAGLRMLAAGGAPVTRFDFERSAQAVDRLRPHPDAARTYLNDGRPYEAGQTLRQPGLAATLRTLAGDGWMAFYDGALGRTIATYLSEHG